MQFLFFFLIMVALWIGMWGCHLSNRPPRKVIQVIEFVPVKPPAHIFLEPPEKEQEELPESPSPVPSPVPKTRWPF